MSIIIPSLDAGNYDITVSYIYDLQDGNGEVEVEVVSTTITIETEEIVDCDATPNHEDCVPQEVDCDLNPDHNDCKKEEGCFSSTSFRNPIILLIAGLTGVLFVLKRLKQ